MKKPIFTVLTHDGVFHSDEVLAVALLEVFSEATAVVTRSRSSSSSDFLFTVDVNGIYKPESGQFDHHQFEKDDALYGLSSAGLVWKYVKENTTIDTELYPSIERLVHEVDEQDTGIKVQEPNHFCNLISGFNVDDIHSIGQMDAFVDAVAFANYIVGNKRRRDDIVQEQLAVANDTTILEIDGMRIAVMKDADRWVPSSMFIDRADIVVFYDKEEDAYTINTVPLAHGSFDTKYKLEESGLPNEIFTHKAGFITKVHCDGGDKCDSVTFNVNGAHIHVPVGEPYVI